ncbi:Sentrin-specific protease 2 [Seminavis robusta]|uniref:Sentrin-specific protease 2 n=1 Tax=Seminavis robusta TaxID=568900 RepID=A0A9N8EYF6_9STRA|nr:Sentrin-specific protease 2 [Seminavis robusta]|eukprot:Sro2486_g329050.1 Sentrin-specific protease 2 (305) ;mRNA; r:104-1018
MPAPDLSEYEQPESTPSATPAPSTRPPLPPTPVAPTSTTNRRQTTGLPRTNQRSPLHRPLLHAETLHIQTALNSSGDLADEVLRFGPDSVSRESLHTLKPGNWLTDEILHSYIGRLLHRHSLQAALLTTYRPSAYFKSFFMLTLLQEFSPDPRRNNIYNYARVSRWHKRLPNEDLFQLQHLLIPINVNRSHWILTVIYPPDLRIQVYDPYHTPQPGYLHATFRFVQDEYFRLHGTALPNHHQWTLQPNDTSAPQQSNGWDCGVFILAYADCILRNTTPTFQEHDLLLYRQWIALSLLEGAIPLG